MVSIFSEDAKSGYTQVVLDPHVTSPGREESSIVRNDQKTENIARESKLYHSARRIFYRGRRASVRRSAGII